MFKMGEIRELIRLLDETSVAELRVETEDMKLHLKKAEHVAAAAPVAASAAPVANMATLVQPAPVATAGMQTPSVDEVRATITESTDRLHTITSPMVGTFYRASAPDAPVYAEIGTRVGDKSVVCIVEAMKLMNEIEAEVSGEVVEILADNGQLVEYGQALFRIKL